MIPVTLITGFLGSGKTTLLRRLAVTYRGRRVVYLVNEFSPLDVDGAIVAADAGDVVRLPGGSIFCQCLVTSFIKTLTDIAGVMFEDGAPAEAVVIEASGVANPKVIERMLRETGLDAKYAIVSIVSVVDPGTFPTLVQTLPNVKAQIESSDLVIVNKTDLFNEEALARTESEVAQIRPGAHVLRARQCAVELDLFPPARARGLDGEYAACADPNFSRFTVRFPGAVDGARLTAALQALGDDLYRAKGFFTGGDGGFYYLDFCPSGVSVEPAVEGRAETGLALILKGAAYDRGRDLLQRAKSGAFAADGQATR